MKRVVVALLLSLFGPALLGVPFAPARAQDVFYSPSVGFEVTKPAEWLYLTADENLANLKRIELDDAEFKQLMEKYATAPLVAMTKHVEPFDDVNPSVKVNIRPAGQLKGMPPKEILSQFIVPQFEKLFADFAVVDAPADTVVSGFDGGHMRINYSMQIPDGRKLPTTSELWILPRGDYLFMIGAGYRQDETTGSRAEILDILDSVKIEP